MIFLQILWNDILPLIVFLAAGWFMDSKFKLDLNTYAKLVTRVVLPVFIPSRCGDNNSSSSRHRAPPRRQRGSLSHRKGTWIYG